MVCTSQCLIRHCNLLGDFIPEIFLIELPEVPNLPEVLNASDKGL